MPSTNQLRYIPDHAAVSLQDIQQFLRDKPRIKALVEGLARGAQVVEDDLFGVSMHRILDLSTHDQLDKWGDLVGEQRGGLDDFTYRRFINARIRANLSEGTTDEMIELLQTITDPSTVYHFDCYPAGFQLTFVHAEAYDDVLAARVGRFMRDVKPAGVTMVLIEAVVGSYGYDDGDRGAEPLDVGGFARVL